MSAGQQGESKESPRPATTKFRLSGDVVRIQKMFRELDRQLEEQRTAFQQLAEVSQRHRRSFESFGRQLQESLAPMQRISEQLADQMAPIGDTSESLTAIVDQLIRPAVADMETWQAALDVPALELATAFRSARLDILPLLDVAVRPAAAAPGAPSASELSTRVLEDIEAAAHEQPESDLLTLAAAVAPGIAEWLGLDQVPRIVLLSGLVTVLTFVSGQASDSRIEHELGEVRATQDHIISGMDPLSESLETGVECAPADSAGEQPTRHRPESP